MKRLISDIIVELHSTHIKSDLLSAIDRSRNYFGGFLLSVTELLLENGQLIFRSKKNVRCSSSSILHRRRVLENKWHRMILAIECF